MDYIKRFKVVCTDIKHNGKNILFVEIAWDSYKKAYDYLTGLYDVINTQESKIIADVDVYRELDEFDYARVYGHGYRTIPLAKKAATKALKGTGVRELRELI